MHVSYRYLLIIVLVAALLCLMPARGADAPNEKKPQTAAAQSVESAEAPAGRTYPPKRTGRRICTARCITRPAGTAFSGGKNCPHSLSG